MYATIRQCVVCGKNILRDYGRCTNACCGECHSRYCSGGGETSPGHGINITKAKQDNARRPHAS